METTHKIRTIELGWGVDSTYFSTRLDKSESRYVDEIVEMEQQIGSRTVLVYWGFRNNEPVFKVFAGSNVTLFYGK